MVLFNNELVLVFINITLALIASFIYIKHVMRGGEISAAMWIVYWVMGITLCAFHWLENGFSSETALLVFYAFVPGLYLCIAFKKGASMTFSKIDTVMLSGAAVAWCMWVTVMTLVKGEVLNEYPALLSIPTLMAILTDTCGTVVGVLHFYKNRTEHPNRYSWLCTAAATVLNLFLVKDWTIAEAAYPVYLAIAMTLLCLVAWLTKPRHIPMPWAPGQRTRLAAE